MSNIPKPIFERMPKSQKIPNIEAFIPRKNGMDVLLTNDSLVNGDDINASVGN